jgi:hypothetical protein
MPDSRPKTVFQSMARVEDFQLRVEDYN